MASKPPTIEVELRALLSNTQRSAMLTHMGSLGALQTIAQVTVDFSAGRSRQFSLMLRSNNGILEAVSKTGKQATAAREEAAIQIAPQTSLLDALRFMGIMGQRTAQVRLRQITVARAQELDITFSLRDVIRHGTRYGGRRWSSTLLEAETLVLPGGERAGEERVIAALVDRGLTPLNANDWHKWVDKTDRQDDQKFQYSDKNAERLVATLTRLDWLRVRP